MAATRFVSVALAMLLAVTMVPAAGIAPAFADEPAAEVADNGLRYKVADGAATLVGFEDGATLEGAVVMPETVGDGAAVKAVEIAEGQVAEGVTSLALPQTVESIQTEGLAAALPALTAIEVAGNGSAYSSVAGMLFRSAAGQASSDGTAFADDALELVWAPPAMVVARVPLECKAIAAGAFVEAAALETVMSFGKMESIAAAEKDADGNVTKPGAFTDEQISRLTIVVPGTNYAVTNESAERVSGSVALSEKTDMLEKRKTWFHYGFDTDQIIMGAPFGEIKGVNAVSDDGEMEDRSLVTPLENGRSHLELTPEEEAEKAARRGEDPEAGLSFSYQASMDLSVRWAGDRSATPAHIDVPAYAKVDGVTYQVTAIEPNAFEGAVFLTSVTIPEGVTAIGESAFAGCANLKEVKLPSTLKTIDYAAFKGTALESVEIPESVRWIGGEAFDEGVDTEPISSSSLVSEDVVAPYWTPGHNIKFPMAGVPMNFEFRRIDKDTGNRYVRYSGFSYDTSSVIDGNSVIGFPGGTNIRVNAGAYLDTGDPLCMVEHWVAGTPNDVPWEASSAYTINLAPYDGTSIINDSLRLYRMEDWSYFVGDAGIGDVPKSQLSNGNWSFGGDVLVRFDTGVPGLAFENQTYMANASDRTFVSLPTPAQAGKKFVGWKLGDVLVDASTSLPDVGIYTLVAQWVEIKKFNIRYEANGGTWVSGNSPTGKQYVEGEGTPLESSSSISREGYWFMGWTPPKTAAIDGDYTSEAPEVVKSAGIDWYGNVVLTAVWKPKTYTLTYDISRAADDSISINGDNPEPFVHPSAIAGVRDLSTDEADLADFRQNNRCIDISDIAAERGEHLDMQMATLSGEPAGYEFRGWAKDERIAGMTPGNDPVWDVGDEGWHTFTKDVVDALWANQDDASTNDPTENKATVYGVYKALGTTAVTLKANGPVGAPADDGKSLEWDASGAPESQTIYYWSKKGLVNASAGQTSETGYVDGAGQDLASWNVNGSTNAAGIERAALVRYGYRLLGWGKQGATRADDVVYVSYDEDADTLALTEDGAELVRLWNGSSSVAAETWDAIWEVRTYVVNLMIPASTVSIDPTKLNGAGYSWQTVTGSQSGWRKATREWDYWDVFATPEYELNAPFNTYEGWRKGDWNDADKQLENVSAKAFITEAQGRNGYKNPTSAEDGALFRVTAEGLGINETDSGLAAPDGEVTLWMKTTPVYINVAAPLGIFLADDEPYVVGSDPRMDLEQLAHFEVKETTHDLVLTSVTATDIVEATVNQETNEVGNVSVVGDASAGGAKGLTDQMLDLKSPGDSKVFWIAPDTTVEPYSKDSQQTPGTFDTDKRVYFGYGKQAGDNVLTDDPDKATDDILKAFKLKRDVTLGDGESALKGETVTYPDPSGGAGANYKRYSFYYGLDLNKCSFNLSNIQKMVSADDAWNYNEGYKRPLVKLMFTFAVERVPGVSYYAMRLGEDEAQSPESHRAGIESQSVDASELVSVRP